MRGIPDPDPVRRPDQPVRPGPLRWPVACCGLGQGQALSDEHAPQRRRRYPHQVLVGATVGPLAMRPIHWAPAFGHVEDRDNLFGQQRVHWILARGLVDQGGGVASTRPPAMHPRVRHLPQLARPGVGEPGGHRVVNGLKDGFFDLGGDPRRHRPVYPQPDFPGQPPARWPGP